MSDFQLTLKGQSMFPLLKEGDRLTFEKVKQDELNEGDVICFVDSQKELTTHRLLELSPFLCKGDNSPVYDQFNDVILVGRLKSYQRAGKSFEIIKMNQSLKYALCLCSKLIGSGKVLRYLGRLMAKRIVSYWENTYSLSSQDRTIAQS